MQDSYRMLFITAASLVIFYLLLWRPQAEQRKKFDAQLLTLKKGDEIVTSGGVVGTVLKIVEATTGKAGLDDRVIVRSGESQLVVERRSITRMASNVAGTSAAAGA